VARSPRNACQDSLSFEEKPLQNVSDGLRSSHLPTGEPSGYFAPRRFQGEVILVMCVCSCVALKLHF